MKILRLDAWDGPNPGGAEVYIDRVSRALESVGHPNVTAVIVTHPPPERMGPVRVFRVPRSPARQAVVGFTDQNRLTEWLDQLAQDTRPDLIHLHHFRAGFPSLGPWLARRKEPIVFTAHDVELACPISTLTLPDGTACPGGILPRCQVTGCEVGFGLPLNLAERYYFDTFVKDHVSTYICVSRATQRVFENLGYRPTSLLRPMIPVPAGPVERHGGPFTIGFLGRLAHQKGVEVLLRAFVAVRRAAPEARLRFGGSGPYTVPRLENVLVDGWVADVTSWFGQIDVLVVPSLGWENLGNSPIEALAHGLPVIVSDSGGLPETIGAFGTVVPQGDSDALASALLRVRSDPVAERARAARGREWVRSEFSPERHLERLLEIYSSASR